jgi:hypothetical protein
LRLEYDERGTMIRRGSRVGEGWIYGKPIDYGVSGFSIRIWVMRSR